MLTSLPLPPHIQPMSAVAGVDPLPARVPVATESAAFVSCSFIAIFYDIANGFFSTML